MHRFSSEGIVKRLFFRLGIAVLTFLIGIALTLGLHSFRHSLRSSEKTVSPTNTQWPEYGSLRWDVQMAKARGAKEYEISSLVCGMEVSTLKEALASYTIVIARPVEKKSFMNTSGLETWYRFKVTETLSSRSARGFHRESLALVEVPTGMLPVNPDEILIPVTGGKLEVEGVTVIHRSNQPRYSLSKTYLLFLALDSDKQVGWVPWTDELGVFTVDDNGTLTATDQESYDIKEKMASRFGNSLEHLKSYLQQQADAKRSLPSR